MKKNRRISPELFQRATGCSAGELRLLQRNAHVAYDSRAHTFDGEAAQVVLQAIRQARQEP